MSYVTSNNDMLVILGIALAITICTVVRYWTTRKRVQPASEDWVIQLHALAEEFQRSSSADQQSAGAVLLDYAHQLRPRAACGCADRDLERHGVR